MYLHQYYSNNTAYRGLMYTQGEDENEITIAVKVPGVEKKDIDIKYSSDKRAILLSVGGDQFHDIYLSRQIDSKNIKAKLELGILTIRAPIKNNDKIIQIT